EPRIALEHQHAAAGGRQISGRHEAVVSRADRHDIDGLRHYSAPLRASRQSANVTNCDERRLIELSTDLAAFHHAFFPWAGCSGSCFPVVFRSSIRRGLEWTH